MSEFGVRQVRARMRRVTPMHARMRRLRRNGPLAIDGQRRHPREGMY